jgi:uncharacterized protein CbrC (UPF0167 family)
VLSALSTGTFILSGISMKTITRNYMKCTIDETYYEENVNENRCFFCGSSNSPVAETESFQIIADNSDQVTHVCLSCLFEKKYAIEKHVEGGYLTGDGILLESDKYEYEKKASDYAANLQKKEEILKNLDDSKITELLHTPAFRAWQGDIWLVHCNDFMTFIGTWYHDDFVKNSPDGDAKKFFDTINDNYNGDDFYDKQFGPNKSEYAEASFYAFQCLHCREFRGYCDSC